ncbi:MAG: autotransporter domain-containing protein, partial [Endomicrobia bacterium]|nr:autotransporter domain-containing protein [Endomicrobiia bacterium]
TNRRIPFVKRTAKADFSGMSINFDAEAALKRPLYKEINLRPYLGFEIKNSNYGSISETGAQSLDMNVSAGSYSRSALRFGAGVNQGNEKYGWHLAAEYKYLVSGNLPEIETEFEEGAGQKFNIVGSEEGKGEIGFKLGGMIRIVKDLRVYADMSCHTADRYSNLYGNVGIRWSFSAQPQPQNKKLAENKEGLSAAAQAKAKAKAEAQAKAKDKAEKAESNRRIVQSKMAAEINERRQRQIEISKAETESETSANIKEFELKSAQQKKIQKEISSTAAQKNDESKSLKKQPKQPADAETGAVKEQEPRTEGLRVVKSSFDVRFTPNAYALSGYWDVEVQKQIDEIKKMDFKKITIEGHADSTEKDGKKISKLRAKSVFDAFVNNGIPADKIDYAGFSSTLPIAKEDTEAGKMANRRVTVIVE